MEQLTREQVIDGIATAIDLMGLKDPNKSMEKLILHYGEEDNITRKEVREYLGKKEKKEEAA